MSALQASASGSASCSLPQPCRHLEADEILLQLAVHFTLRRLEHLEIENSLHSVAQQLFIAVIRNRLILRLCQRIIHDRNDVLGRFVGFIRHSVHSALEIVGFLRRHLVIAVGVHCVIYTVEEKLIEILDDQRFERIGDVFAFLVVRITLRTGDGENIVLSRCAPVQYQAESVIRIVEIDIVRCHISLHGTQFRQRRHGNHRAEQQCCHQQSKALFHSRIPRLYE